MAILDLPDEVIRLVLDFVDTPSTFISVSTTCKRLNLLSQPYIYSSVKINTAQGLKLFPMQAIQARLKLFRCLTIEELSGEMPVGYFSPWIGQMSNLQNLRITSPYWHFSEFGNNGYEDEEGKSPQRYDEQGRPLTENNGKAIIDWPHEQDKLCHMFEANSLLTVNLMERILPSLRFCYVRYNEQNGQAWFIDFEPVFFSTTLVHLTLEGCFFHEGDFGDFVDEKQEIRSSLRFSTPLEHLYLLDCNINPVALSRIMTIPKALKTIGLSQMEATHHEMAPRNIIPLNFDTYTDIFQIQEHALESLHFCHLPYFRGGQLRADFTQLPAARTMLLGFWLSDEVDDLASHENWTQSLDFDSDNHNSLEIGVRMPACLQNLRFPELLVDVGYLPYKEDSWIRFFVPRLRWAFHLRQQQCPNLRTIILPVSIDSFNINAIMDPSQSSSVYVYDEELESLAEGVNWTNWNGMAQDSHQWNMENDHLTRDLMKMKQSVESVGFEAQILVRHKSHITIRK